MDLEVIFGMTIQQLKTWMVFDFSIHFRNIEKPSNRVFDRQKGPLIGCVLWTDDEPNQVNYTIKSILKLFVDYVSIDFPSDETQLLSVSLDFQTQKISHPHGHRSIKYVFVFEFL